MLTIIEIAVEVIVIGVHVSFQNAFKMEQTYNFGREMYKNLVLYFVTWVEGFKNTISQLLATILLLLSISYFLYVRYPIHHYEQEISTA